MLGRNRRAGTLLQRHVDADAPVSTVTAVT